MTTIQAWAAFAAEKTTPEPTSTTYFFAGVMILGCIIAFLGVRRNDLKQKAGVAVFGLILAVAGGVAGLYIR